MRKGAARCQSDKQGLVSCACLGTSVLRSGDYKRVRIEFTARLNLQAHPPFFVAFYLGIQNSPSSLPPSSVDFTRRTHHEGLGILPRRSRPLLFSHRFADPSSGFLPIVSAEYDVLERLDDGRELHEAGVYSLSPGASTSHCECSRDPRITLNNALNINPSPVAPNTSIYPLLSHIHGHSVFSFPRPTSRFSEDRLQSRMFEIHNPASYIFLYHRPHSAFSPLLF